MKYPFIHLRTQSSYSLAESALKINKLVNLAKINNMPAIALVDNNNMFGALEFSIECINNGIQPILGTSINFLDVKLDGIPSQLNFLVKDEKGYKNLLYLSSLSHTSENNPIGIYADDLKKHTDGLICFIGGEFNPILFLHLQNKNSLIDKTILFFKDLYKDNILFEIQRINDPKIDEFENYFLQCSEDYKIPLIGSNNIKFEKKKRF